MINYTELLVEAKFLDTKPPETHDMCVFNCGTASCALGDIGIRNFEDEFISYERIFGFTPGYDDYCYGTAFDPFFAFLFSEKPKFASGWCPVRYRETPQQTAARIRKFVHYRRKKEAIFAEYNEELQRGRHLFQGGVVDIAGEVLSELEAV